MLAVTVTGEPGIGKSAVAIAAINYLAERHYFSDGVLYIDVSSIRSINELARILRSHISVFARAQSSTPPQLTSELQATELQVASP